MKASLSYLSVLFGVISAILVFTPIAKTPPLPITIFGVLGLIVGFIGMRDMKGVSLIGIILSAASLIYLIILFAGLGS